MLPRAHRLQTSADIKEVVRSGQVVATPWIHLYLLSRPMNLYSRVACIVGKKVHTRATERHRYQRWLRELSRPLIERLAHPHDLVLVAQPPITTFITPTKRQRAHEQLHALLDKAVATGDN